MVVLVGVVSERVASRLAKGTFSVLDFFTVRFYIWCEHANLLDLEAMVEALSVLLPTE